MADNPFAVELTRRQGGNPFRDELQRRTPQEPMSLLDENLSSAKSFVGGALDVVGLPADLINAPLEAAGLPTIPSGGRDLRALAARYGLAYAPGEEPAGVGNRASRILGSAAIPYAGVVGRGAQLARPGTTFALESGSVAGATAGGELGEKVAPGSELAPVLGELAGGFTPGIVGSVPTVTGLAIKGIKAGAFPFTKAGGRIRAARRVQGLAADPAEAAARVGGSDTLPVPLSPARRTGDKRLLALEQAVAKEDPALDARLTQGLSDATRQTRGAGIEGDAGRARKVLEQRRGALLSRLNRDADQAQEQAQAAVAKLSPDATPQEISAAARGKLKGALADAKATETDLWNDVDRALPASMNGTRETMADILAERGPRSDPNEIPPWLTQEIGREIEGGDTLGDIHDLRKRVGNEIDKAKRGEDRSTLRVLSQVYDSLLDDMRSAQGQDAALDAAISYSRGLNQKFRQGPIGRLLGYESRGALAVAPEDTLQRIVSGQASGTQVARLLEAAPDARGELTDYLRSAFRMQAVDDSGNVNARAARAFVRKNDAVLEQLPELRAELSDVRELSRQAQRLGQRQKRVGKLASDARKSRAALYLDSPVGEEWGRVLNSSSPARDALALRRKMGDDAKAVQGLKSSFVDEIMRRSETSQFDEAGQVLISGNRMKALLDEHAPVMRSLGMSEAERTRLDTIANTLSRIEAKPGAPEKINDDLPAGALDLMARLIGAHTGQKIATGGTGSSLVMAQAFSQRMRGVLRRLTRDKATQIIAASIEDPDLFRALLVGPTARARRQDEAAKVINAWLAAPTAEQAQEQPE